MKRSNDFLYAFGDNSFLKVKIILTLLKISSPKIDLNNERQVCKEWSNLCSFKDIVKKIKLIPPDCFSDFRNETIFLTWLLSSLSES